MTVKGWIRALTGGAAVAVAFVGLLTWHIAPLVLGIGVLLALDADDRLVSERASEPEIPTMDLREARYRGRA